MMGPRKRTALFLGSCFLAGAAAASLVYIGDHFQWPGFNSRAGYFGTGFMDSLLYAINDPYAIHIVATVWFCYAATTTCFIGIVIGLIRRRFCPPPSNESRS